MTQSTHDTLVYRLAGILTKLNQGQRLSPQELAQEYGVNLRTIQRDLNVRFAYLPLQKSNGYYSLEAAYLGKLNTKDVQRFAGLAGVSKLFPSLGDVFFRDLFSGDLQSAILVKGHNYENLDDKQPEFHRLEEAINQRRHITVEYLKGSTLKVYPRLAPFKLVNQKGIWYLVAMDESKLKSFAFTKINNFRLLASSFEPDPDIEQRLADEDGIWFSDEPINVTLHVDRQVASYFKRRTLVANQTIEEESLDGSIIISAKVGHPNQIMPIVRYWIPHVRILSPVTLQAELREMLANYIGTR